MPISSIDVTNCADITTTDAVHQYFSQLNPIAERIASDIDATKLTYGNLWHKLKLHEQNDIINETLIKPEIALRYFDNFASTTTSSSKSSFCARNLSTDSLTAVVLQNFNYETPASTTAVTREKLKTIDNKEYMSQSAKPKLYNLKNIYAYDLRNLHTFAIQKVALKLVHDDPKCEYRDEHSKPFSFRTKSQINLFIEQIPKTDIYFDEPTPRDKHNESHFLNGTTENKQKSNNFHCTDKNSIGRKNQNAENIENKNFDTKLESASKRSLSHAEHFGDVALNNVKSAMQSKFIGNLSQSTKKNNKINSNYVLNDSKNSAYAKALLDATPVQLNYAIYTSIQQENEESEKLMQNCRYKASNSDLLLTGASSSSTTSDDDDDIYADDNYEKTLYEGVKLLDDMNLRSGFDFLNNW